MRITPWLIFLLVSTTIAFIYPYLIHSFTKLDLPGNIGEFGDMYGVLNPVISALAFFGVMYSLFLQQKQIRLQREDLKNQRADLKLQREEMVKQREVSEAQTRQFEAQVKLAEKGQKIDELYKRLTIVVQFAEEVVFASLKTSISYDERQKQAEMSEKATRAIYMIQVNLKAILRTCYKGLQTLQAKREYIYDRFLNVERWLEALLSIIQYVRYSFNEEESVEFAKMIMSTCSNSQKFLMFAFAGADDHDRGEDIRSFLIEKQIVSQEIIPDMLLDAEFRCKLDDLIRSMNTHEK